MKKFVKWFLFWLVVLGGLALAICYMVIPNETKSAMDIVIGYANTPLGIVGGTTITLGMVAYFVVSHLLKLNRDKAKQDFNECKQELEQKKQELDNKVQEFKKECELKLEEHKQTLVALEESALETIEILKLIPNKKVQERLEELYGREERTND